MAILHQRFLVKLEQQIIVCLQHQDKTWRTMKSHFQIELEIRRNHLPNFQTFESTFIEYWKINWHTFNSFRIFIPNHVLS